MFRLAVALCFLAGAASAAEMPCGVYQRADRIERGERGYAKICPGEGTPGVLRVEQDSKDHPIVTMPAGRVFFTDEMIPLNDPRAAMFPEH